MTQWEIDQIRKGLRGDQSSVIEKLRAQLLASESARIIERRALEFYAHRPRSKDFPEHCYDASCGACVERPIGKTAREALQSQPAPEIGEVVRRLVVALEMIARFGCDSLTRPNDADRAIEETKDARAKWGIL